MVDVIGRGIYTIPEAAKLIGTRSQNLRRWFVGRKRNEHFTPPVFAPDYSKTADDDIAISFNNLIEAKAVASFRELNVPMQTLRKVHDALAKHFKHRYPFCDKKLETDGHQIFLRVLEENDEPKLVDVLTKQHYMDAVMRPYLKGLEFGDDDLTKRWHIRKGIVIDPARQYGAPCVENAKLQTRTLYDAYLANGRSFDVVADWFEVSPNDVEAAVTFEKSLLH